MILYRFCQRLVRLGWPLIGPLEVHGLENVPEHGPFLLIANHQSILDPILVQAIMRRPLYTMAKSTQFTGRIMGWLMPRLLAFPVRRYRVDPQVVRVALRHLDRGDGVGVYIEGERSWDGRLQPPRLGTVRLVLKAGVPVIPCGVSGTYDVWPRWDRGLRRAPVGVAFGAPIRFPKLDDRAEREKALPKAASDLMAAIAAQIAVATPRIAPRDDRRQVRGGRA
ncbi:MAG: 1-acyl-sn-glycerol-3-phosphate acyltransferase [Gemmatimonadetes bacterium]|nr:1-acyl-sn-glycerol-3-phosphate acyltransferase [Gemmatimonadota bacterium]